jgi:hypothetical protein
MLPPNAKGSWTFFICSFHDYLFFSDIDEMLTLHTLLRWQFSETVDGHAIREKSHVL